MASRTGAKKRIAHREKAAIESPDVRVCSGTDTMESSDLPVEDRGAIRQSIEQHQRHLELIHENLAKSRKVIKRAENAVSDSTGLLK
jgi:hypothetical protein